METVLDRRRRDRVEDEHLSLEMLAKWLSGGLEHDEALNRVIPHFLAQCPTCRERRQEILDLQKEVRHWNEEVVVLEGQLAPEQWAELAGLLHEERLRRIEEDETLHTWGLCQLLLKKSREVGFDNPSEAVSLANLAVKVAGHLGEAYDPNWVLDLRATAFAYLGNARRILGELRSAEDAFQKAEKYLARSGSGDIRTRAEVLDLKGSLRRAQRRLEEALDLVDQALLLYREIQDSHGTGKALLKRAKILEENGNLKEAIEFLAQSSPEIAGQPRLFAYARYNLLGCLTLAGRHQEAEQLLPEVRALFQDTAQPLDLVRLRWAEGLIALGLGRLGPAEAAFREVQQEFLKRDMGYDAALVSLDLARLYSQEGCKDELKRLAAELMPIFEAQDVQRETLVSLLLFQRACEEERATVELIQQIAEHLRRERRGNGGVG
jgi:tetratricopeptide (TPR) repeat protein